MTMNNSMVSRFFGKFLMDDADKCWEWSGHKDKDGYGRMRPSGSKSNHIPAQRISWFVFNGEDAGSLFVCHHCDNPSCVNPSHLFLGTATDNNRDKSSKGRHHFSYKTSCKHGHPYDDSNTYYQPSGSRVCRKCQYASVKKYEAKKRTTQ